jgi:hypothetical protein
MGDVYMPWTIKGAKTFGLAYCSSTTLNEWYWLKTMDKTTCTCLLWMGDVIDQNDTNTLKAWKPFKHSKELYKKVCNQKQNCMSFPMKVDCKLFNWKGKKLKKGNQDSYMNS